MRAAEGYVRGAYFIVARRRLSSLEGPRSWGHLGVDRSLLFFPALLKPRPDRVSLAGMNTYGLFRVNGNGDSPRLRACEKTPKHARRQNSILALSLACRTGSR